MKIPSKSIPQANDLDLVVAAVEAVSQGARTDVEISNHLATYRHRPSRDPGRDGRYYRLPGELLGFITNDQNEAHLTSLGKRFIQASDDRKEQLLLKAVLDQKLFRSLIPFFELNPHGVTESEIADFISDVTTLSETTVYRRLSTIVNWLKRVDVIEESNGLINLRSNVAQNVPLVEFQDIDEPILPQSSALKEYKIVEERNQTESQEITVTIDTVKTERANKAHINLTNLVAERIQRTGKLPHRNQYIDLAAQIENRSYIFEMKSITDQNARVQIRHGLSQLYEYRYLQNLPNAILVLVVEKRLPERVAWMQQYLEDDRQILLLWDGNNQLYSSTKTREELAFLW